MLLYKVNKKSASMVAAMPFVTFSAGALEEEEGSTPKPLYKWKDPLPTERQRDSLLPPSDCA